MGLHLWVKQVVVPTITSGQYELISMMHNADLQEVHRHQKWKCADGYLGYGQIWMRKLKE